MDGKYSKISAQLARQNDNTITSSSQLHTAIGCAVALLLYLGLGILFLTNYGSLSYFDALYFVVVTFTTVGFGDIRVEGMGQKLFLSCFVFLGLMVLTGGVKVIYRYWTIKREDLKQLMATYVENDEDENNPNNDADEEMETTPKGRVKFTIESQIALAHQNGMMQSVSNIPTGTGTRDFIQRTVSAIAIYGLAESVYNFWVVRMGIPPYAIPIIKEMLIGLCLIFINVAVGTLFYAVVVDDMSVVNAVYFTCMTITTIGYGDILPSNSLSKIFTMFYCIVGTLVTARALACFHHAFDKYQEGAHNDAILTSKVDLKTLFAMDIDENRNVDIEEFLLYRIFEMKLVDPEIIRRLERQFSRLDKNGDGVITPSDLDVADFVGLTNKPSSRSSGGAPPRRGGLSASGGISLRGSAIIHPMDIAAQSVRAAEEKKCAPFRYSPASTVANSETTGVSVMNSISADRRRGSCSSSYSDCSTEDISKIQDVTAAASVSVSDKKEAYASTTVGSKCSRVIEVEDMEDL